MTRVIIYCRQSNADKESDSLDRQEATCLKYAADKGYEVIAVLKEKPGTSGAKFNAPELDKAIKAARQNLFDVLLVRDVARFGRDRLKFELKELELNGYNVTVEYVWQQFDDTPEGKLNKDFIVMFEEYKRASIAKHLVSGRRDKVEQYNSFLVHGRPPLGYNANRNGKIIEASINEFEAVIVKRIFQLYAENSYSLAGIAQELNETETPCYSNLRSYSNFGSKDSKWYPSAVRTILKNSTYKGQWHYGKEGIRETTRIVDNEIVTIYERVQNDENYLLTVEVPAIVSPDTWQAAQDRLSKNKNHRGRKSKYEYLLGRRISCFCGSKMCPATRKPANKLFLYYHCPNHDQRNGATCEQKNIRADKLDALAWRWMEELLKDRDKLKARIDVYLEQKDEESRPLLEQVDRLDTLISRRKREYDKLIDLYLASSDFGQTQLLERKNRLEQDLQADEQKRRDLQEQLDQLNRSLKALAVWRHHYDNYRSHASEEMLRWGNYQGEDNHASAADFTEYYAKSADIAREQGMLNDDTNYWLLAKLAKNGGELTFEEKRGYVERFNLRVELIGQDNLRVSCDFDQTILPFLNQSMYCPVRITPFTTPQFLLYFSDVLKLDFSCLPHFQQVGRQI